MVSAEQCLLIVRFLNCLNICSLVGVLMMSDCTLNFHVTK